MLEAPVRRSTLVEVCITTQYCLAQEVFPAGGPVSEDLAHISIGQMRIALRQFWIVLLQRVQYSFGRNVISVSHVRFP